MYEVGGKKIALQVPIEEQIKSSNIYSTNLLSITFLFMIFYIL